MAAWRVEGVEMARVDADVWRKHYTRERDVCGVGGFVGGPARFVVFRDVVAPYAKGSNAVVW